MSKEQRYELQEETAGRRVDAVLAELAEISRSQARRWIDAGRVKADGEVVRPSFRVSAGTTLVADPPDPTPSEIIPESIPLAILHDDSDLIVLDKAPGMVVHPGPGHATGTLVHALLHHCRAEGGIGGLAGIGGRHLRQRGARVAATRG